MLHRLKASSSLTLGEVTSVNLTKIQVTYRCICRFSFSRSCDNFCDNWWILRYC